jgi:hypothetical protein
MERMACIIDSWVPTASMTECALGPLGGSLMRATSCSPRSVRMSVAPKSGASFWRGLVVGRTAGGGDEGGHDAVDVGVELV